MNPTQQLYTYCEAFFAELRQLGVRSVVVSPGSRSTPLALTSQQLHQTVVLDERSAGFVALGIAKTTRTPVALICTSGTAAANYLPAVVEAFHAKVPLLVLTADRPLAVRHWGAPQTINQSQLYGAHVGWFGEVVPPPSNALQAGRNMARRVFSEAGAGKPVHLNWPMSKPLEPPEASRFLEPSQPQPATAPASTAAPATEPQPAADDLAIAARLSQLASRPGVLVVGSCDLTPSAAMAVATFATQAGWPVLSEATSGMRFMGANPKLSEVVLANGHFLGSCHGLLPRPEVVVRVGPNPIDAALLDFLRQHPPELAIDAPGSWNDPEFIATELVQANLETCFSHAAATTPAATSANAAPTTPNSDWLMQWRKADVTASQALTSVLAESTAHGLSQAHAVRILADSIQPDQMLYVASSLAVRDFEYFAGSQPIPARVLANRGANGIDGMISSAIGAAVGANQSVTLLLGDLALLHDLGALLLASQLKTPLRIVALNNNGGGIFSQLPIAEAVPGETFERLFTTPHQLDLSFLGNLPGVTYQQLANPTDLRQALKTEPASSQSADQPAVTILEIACDPEAHLKQLHRCRQAVKQSLERTTRPASAQAESDPAPAATPTHTPADQPQPAAPPASQAPLEAPPSPAPDPAQPAATPAPPPSPPTPLPLLHATEWSTAGKPNQPGQLPVVLLHGFMGSIAAMRALVGDLFHTYRVLAVDLPGHGKSLMPLEPHSFTTDTAAELLWKTLDDKGIDKAHLVGYSMGGRIGLTAAVLNPHRVASMTCLGASPGISDPHHRSERLQADSHRADVLLADGLESFVEQWLAQPMFAELPKKLSQKDWDSYRQQRLAANSENLAMSLRHGGAGSMEPLQTSLHQAPFACLWIAGEHDLKYRQIAFEMAQLMPQGSTAVIGQANHAVHVENPGETARAIRNFLASLA